MLNCIMGMMEKTVRALTILQQRSTEQGNTTSWPMPVSKPSLATNSVKSSALPAASMRPSFAPSSLASLSETPELEATINEEFVSSGPLNLHKQPTKELVNNGHQNSKSGKQFTFFIFPNKSN